MNKNFNTNCKYLYSAIKKWKKKKKKKKKLKLENKAVEKKCIDDSKLLVNEEVLAELRFSNN